MCGDGKQTRLRFGKKLRSLLLQVRNPISVRPSSRPFFLFSLVIVGCFVDDLLLFLFHPHMVIPQKPQQPFFALDLPSSNSKKHNNGTFISSDRPGRHQRQIPDSFWHLFSFKAMHPLRLLDLRCCLLSCLLWRLVRRTSTTKRTGKSPTSSG